MTFHSRYLSLCLLFLFSTIGCVEEDPLPPLQPNPTTKPKPEEPDPPFEGALGAEFESVGDDRGPYDLPRKVRHRATGLVLILVPQGRYTMGTPDSEHGRDSDEVQRPGRVRRPFYLAETEVTVEQWKQLMGEDDLSPEEKQNAQLPKSGVSWKRASEFLAKMNEKYEEGWRLPTEMEWEFACRAGTTTPFSTGEDIGTDQANYDGRRPYRGRKKGLHREGPVAVRSFPPNPWGFYDMHGNLWEWCSDLYVSHPEEGKVARDEPGEPRVMRGGAFTSRGKQLRSGYRDGYPPANSTGQKYGFRIAKTIPKK